MAGAGRSSIRVRLVAMLFVISHEIIPESHRQGHEAHATIGLMLGFVIMMLLDTALG